MRALCRKVISIGTRLLPQARLFFFARAIYTLIASLALAAPVKAAIVCQTYQTVCAAACTYTTIQAAVNAIPGTALSGNWCIDVTDNNTYAAGGVTVGRLASVVVPM